MAINDLVSFAVIYNPCNKLVIADSGYVPRPEDEDLPKDVINGLIERYPRAICYEVCVIQESPEEYAITSTLRDIFLAIGLEIVRKVINRFSLMNTHAYSHYKLIKYYSCINQGNIRFPRSYQQEEKEDLIIETFLP